MKSLPGTFHSGNEYACWVCFKAANEIFSSGHGLLVPGSFPSRRWSGMLDAAAWGSPLAMKEGNIS